MELEEVRRRMEDLRPSLRKLGVSSLHVFGSVARHDAGPDSDVDVLVDFDGPASFDRFMDVRFLLEDALGCTVDLVTRNGLRPGLAESVLQEATPVA